MSQKDTLQKETSQKIVTKYDRKVQRRKEAERKAKQRAKIEKTIGIVILALIVIGLLSIPVRKQIATHSTYIKVGDHEITRVEFDYYYNLAKTDYINTYGSYLSYMGLNIYGDLSTQPYNATMSWKDYFDQLAVEGIQQNKALVDAAKAAGFTYDSSKEYDDFAESLKEAAAAAGETIGHYYRSAFGQYATASNLKPFIEEGYLASAYYNEVTEAKAASEAEILAYYNDNRATYDSVDFLVTTINAEIPEAQTQTDENGETTTIEPTEEEIQAAMDEAKMLADAALETIAEEGEAMTNLHQINTSTYYREWLFDDTRTEGDTTVIEDATNHCYYVLQFKNRYLQELPTATIRAIMSTAVDGEAILAEWEAAGGTEDAFISLVETYSQDTYSYLDGGIYRELLPSSLDSILSEWIFADERAYGDTVTMTEDDIVYVLYYVEQGRPEYQVQIANTLLSTTMNDYMTELAAAYEISDPKGHLVYLHPVTESSTDGSEAETE